MGAARRHLSRSPVAELRVSHVSVFKSAKWRRFRFAKVDFDVGSRTHGRAPAAKPTPGFCLLRIRLQRSKLTTSFPGRCPSGERCSSHSAPGEFIFAPPKDRFVGNKFGRVEHARRVRARIGAKQRTQRKGGLTTCRFAVPCASQARSGLGRRDFLSLLPSGRIPAFTLRHSRLRLQCSPA
jgi:hypothetical protein